MGVDDAERCRLAAQIMQDAAKHGMLENIGKIAGMECVAIIHVSLEGSAMERMQVTVLP